MSASPITNAFFVHLAVPSSPTKNDILSDQPGAQLALYLAERCNTRVETYSPGVLGEHLAFCRSDILTAVNCWVEDQVASGNLCLMIYFCGHGVLNRDGCTLITADMDPNGTPQTGLALHSIYHLCRQFEERGARFFLVLDACLTGDAARPFFAERLPKNTSIFFSTKRGLISTQCQGSIFINGLKEAIHRSRSPQERNGFHSSINAVSLNLSTELKQFGFDQFLSHPDEMYFDYVSSGQESNPNDLSLTLTSKPTEAKFYNYARQVFFDEIPLAFERVGLAPQIKPKESKSTSLAQAMVTFRATTLEEYMFLFNVLEARYTEVCNARLEIHGRSTTIKSKMESLCGCLEECYGSNFFSEDRKPISKMTVQLGASTQVNLTATGRSIDISARQKRGKETVTASLIHGKELRSAIQSYILGKLR